MSSSQFNRFARNPVSANITRSRFRRPSQHKTTFDAGQLIPVFVDEVLPGDTCSLDTACVVRMSTPVHPVMDNAFMDLYYFFVPNRLIWDHWKEFMGENTEGPWSQLVEYEVPQLKLHYVKSSTIYDYFGFEPGVRYGTTTSINALPIRAYGLIWNEWFRDQNVSSPVFIDTGDATVDISNFDTFISYFSDGTDRPYADMVTDWMDCGLPLPVAKDHDYFTSALPMPQKGPAVTLPITDAELPVRTPNEGHDAMTLVTDSGGSISNDYLITQDGLLRAAPSPDAAGVSLIPGNLIADASGLSAFSINVFRQAYALQLLYEKDARGGSRYTEIIRSHFGVSSPDARQQRPEYLCGKRVPITVSQVVQTSATDSTSPQGNTAAVSLTQDASQGFTFSATEHGYIIGVACVRTNHTYQQGIERMWSRKRRYDFYDPVFANLGEQAILNKELRFTGSEEDEDVFAYQEAWVEYRMKPSRVSGLFRSSHTQSLDVWHYADNFASTPTLSPEFIYETKENIKRTLAVQNQPQFIADFYFDATWVRPMPVYSIPGLASHY